MTGLSKPFFVPDTPVWKLQPVPVDLDSAHHLAEISWGPRPTEPKGMRETRREDASPWATENPEL